MRLPPCGDVRVHTGEVLHDPGAQARGVIETVFQQFGRYGTINGVLPYLVDHHIPCPGRVRRGPRTGELGCRVPANACRRWAMGAAMGRIGAGEQPIAQASTAIASGGTRRLKFARILFATPALVVPGAESRLSA